MAEATLDPVTSVWSELVGQARAVEILQRATAGGPHAMSHAWLITGPPGSGRSNAARAFAAALQCTSQTRGCGACQACRTALSGAHPDVTWVRTEQLSIGVDEVRGLVRAAMSAPVVGNWQIILIEDADRLTDPGADALLKAVEEPAPRTVWLLCAPTPDDVPVTIRSRSRRLQLVTPPTDEVAGLLVRRDGIDPQLAEEAARAAQGHIGSARHLARDDESRARRLQILQIPQRLTGLGECLACAAELVSQAEAEARRRSAAADEKERAELEETLGISGQGARKKHAAAALRDLADQQKARAKRLQRDSLDLALTELTTWYRDVLSVQLATGAPLVNLAMTERIHSAAASGTAEATIQQVDAILACRRMLDMNVAPLLAMERLMVALRMATLRRQSAR